MTSSWIHGLLPEVAVLEETSDVRSVLEDILRPALAGARCYVAFSGGRDSSAVLAAAVSLARREGLSDPIPVTERYPDVPQANEDHWQHLVVDHLGLKEWIVLEFHDENDLLGETAQQGLRTRGLIWPPVLQIKANALAALSPGTLLSGEGGDEVFGARRAAPWPHLSKRTVTSRRLAAGAAASSLFPAPIRRAQNLTELRRSQLQPWLRSPVADQHLRLAAADAASEPLRWDRSLLWLLRRRSAAVTAQNYALVAAEHRIRLLDPFLEPRFLAALGRVGGRWGFSGRAAALRELFSDVLPAAVIERPTKALFNRAFLGEATRAFARVWDGSGVNSEDIDVERLRAEWLSDEPSAISGVLLQSAWLASENQQCA